MKLEHQLTVSFCSRVLGALPKDEELDAYLEAYFGDRLSEDQRAAVVSKAQTLYKEKEKESGGFFDNLQKFVQGILGGVETDQKEDSSHVDVEHEASNIATLLLQSTQEMESVVGGLDGRYIRPKPGGGTFMAPNSCCLFFLAYITFAEHLVCALNRFAARWSECSANW